MYGCGANSDYKIVGKPYSKHQSFTVPVKLAFPPNDIKAVACGDNQSFFLDESGVVWTSGVNTNGRIYVDEFTKGKPTKLKNLPRIVDLVSGLFHSLFLDENGVVYGMGRNEEGQLGRKDEAVIAPVIGLPKIRKLAPIFGTTSAFLDEDGTVWMV